MSAVTTEDPDLADGRPAVTRAERGAMAWGLAAAAVVATALVVLLPLGHSQFDGIIWLWVVALVGVVVLNLLVPVESWTGVAVKWTTLAGCLAFLVVFPIGRSNSTLLDMGLFAVFGMVCIGTNLTHGFAGKITLAQAAFLGIGAYVSVLLDTGREIVVGGAAMTLPNLPFLLAIAIAGLTCMVLSVLIGFPALRVQGPWLAFVTLAFNLLVYLVLNNEAGVTEGSRGIRIPRDDVVVFGIDLTDGRNYYYFCLAFLVMATALVWWIVRSPWGRAFKALRDNPARAVQRRRGHSDLHADGLLRRRGTGRHGGCPVRAPDRVHRSARVLHRSIVRLLPRDGRRRARHTRRPVHRRVVHHRARGPAAHRRRSLPGVVRHLRRRHDADRSQGNRRIVQPTARDVAEASSRQRHEELVMTVVDDGPDLAAGDETDVVVRVRNITKSFGGIRAVDDVSFDLRKGEILGVIGPNGCGKSTLFNCILGQYRPDEGRIELDDRDVSRWRPHRRSKAGLARTFQLLQVFQSMSVRDNLRTAAQEHIGSIGRRLFRRPDMGLDDRIDRLIERFRLAHRR